MLRLAGFSAVAGCLVSSLAFAKGPFTLTSTTLKPGQTMSNSQVFNSFGCMGENKSPDLQWSDAPEGTKSFAVTMFDPDAPTGSGWWHWTVFNIPADAKGLALGAGAENSSALPKGAIQGRTDFGKPGYGGPCPPPGAPHRYIFRVAALKDMIQADKESSGAMIGFNIGQMKLAEATLEVKYGRSK